MGEVGILFYRRGNPGLGILIGFSSLHTQEETDLKPRYSHYRILLLSGLSCLIELYFVFALWNCQSLSENEF